MLDETHNPEKLKAPAISTAATYLIRHIELQRLIRYAIARRLRREKTCARIVVSFLSLIIIASSIGSASNYFGIDWPFNREKANQSPILKLGMARGF
jgi:hypothetical protein